ncbi:MAG: hypothetical protein AAF226_17750 [Verrucomicrobiota bacterium]
MDVEENVRRVALRVQKGGHHVPEEDIRRRFVRAHANFWEMYRGLADYWQVFSNPPIDGRLLLADGAQSGIRVSHEEFFEKFLKICYSVP